MQKMNFNKIINESKKTRLFTKLSVLISVIILSYFIFSILVTPQTDRNWTNDQKVLPNINIDEKNISIKNIRNFKYKSVSDYKENYYDSVFEKGSVKNVWFIVEPFEGPGAAHTFLSFEFEDGRFLAISIEIRKEVGESFHPISGLFRKYELNYVIADESDVIGLRANHRKDRVYLYEGKTTKEKANQLFESMLLRAKSLQEKPEFYNTLTNTCTTNLVSHINDVTEGKIPFDLRVLFPENSDKYAFELGLIATDVSKEEIKGKYNINDLAKKYADQDNFSEKIREDFK